MLGPIPMLHLGTKGKGGAETITPGAIAAGEGDGYLVALNHAISVWGKGIYVRPMAEMNNGNALYSAYGSNGQPKDEAHSTANYRKAFARIYLILHGGTEAAIDAKLRQLGMPPLRGGDQLVNPFPQLRILWSPLAGGNPRVAGNAPERYYPGAAYVDVQGGDIYVEGGTAPWDALEALYRFALSHHEPFSVPEWGLYGIDDAAFVRRMCDFLKTRRQTEVSVFYESKPGSQFDLGNKPASAAAYRACITPLAGELPTWAVSAATTLKELSLTPTPDSGDAPLAVRYAVKASLSVPVQHWSLLFGDGTETGGSGAPPASVSHTYAKEGVYQALLFVFQAPPFELEDATFFTAATVTAGAGSTALVSFVPTPASGNPPLKVSFRTDLALPASPRTWTIVFGDGITREGTGVPPHFVGHTYTREGAYAPLLVLELPGARRYAATVALTVGSPGGGGGGGGGGGPTTTTTPRPGAGPPATGTPTGTVLVNGRPFTGGQIPYNTPVDVTRGRLLVRADVGTLQVYGAGVTATFVLVRGTDRGRPVVEFRLTGGNFSVCKRRTQSAGRATATVVRQLWGNGRGSFRTRGRYAAATISGTVWLTADRCDGTQVKVTRGVVRVTAKGRQTLVRAGRSFLARP
jgi:PKD repeat protein